MQTKVALEVVSFIINVPLGITACYFVAVNTCRMGNVHHISRCQCYVTAAMGGLVLGQYVFDFGHRPSMTIYMQIHHVASITIGVYTVLRLFPDHPEHSDVPVLLQVNQWLVGVFHGLPFAAVCAALAYYRLGSTPWELKAWLRTAIICYWSKIPLAVLYLAWLWHNPLLSSGQKFSMTAGTCIVAPANIFSALQVCSLYKMCIKMIDAGDPAQKRPSFDCCASDPENCSGIEIATQTDEYELVNMHGPFCARAASIIQDISRVPLEQGTSSTPAAKIEGPRHHSEDSRSECAAFFAFGRLPRWGFSRADAQLCFSGIA